MGNSASYEPQQLAYDIPTASRVSTLGRTKLYELIASGKLESTTVGKRRLILGESLRRLVEEGC
jgi:excisionase family DNA binding protein